MVVASLAEVAQGDSEPEVREEKVEGGVVVGAVGAPGLLRLNEYVWSGSIASP